MTARSIEILQQARSLTEKERADLAGSLLSSLDTTPDPQAEILWQQEISRRTADLDAGKARTIPWDQVRTQVCSSLDHPQNKR
jgi:putative addiction module component (TIGR02574 family)